MENDNVKFKNQIKNNWFKLLIILLIEFLLLFMVMMFINLMNLNRRRIKFYKNTVFRFKFEIF